MRKAYLKKYIYRIAAAKNDVKVYKNSGRNIPASPSPCALKKCQYNLAKSAIGSIA